MTGASGVWHLGRVGFDHLSAELADELVEPRLCVSSRGNPRAGLRTSARLSPHHAPQRKPIPNTHTPCENKDPFTALSVPVVAIARQSHSMLPTKTKPTLSPTNTEVQAGPFQEQSSLSTGVSAPNHVSWWEGNEFEN